MTSSKYFCAAVFFLPYFLFSNFYRPFFTIQASAPYHLDTRGCTSSYSFPLSSARHYYCAPLLCHHVSSSSSPATKRAKASRPAPLTRTGSCINWQGLDTTISSTSLHHRQKIPEKTHLSILFFSTSSFSYYPSTLLFFNDFHRDGWKSVAIPVIALLISTLAIPHH